MAYLGRENCIICEFVLLEGKISNFLDVVPNDNVIDCFFNLYFCFFLLYFFYVVMFEYRLSPQFEFHGPVWLDPARSF